MSVKVIEPGRKVVVGPGELDADDILEFGAALIEEHGHTKGESGDAAKGWSIHGAIGEAASRATGGAKDSSAARALREQAAEKIRARHAPDAPDGTEAEFRVSDAALTPTVAADFMLAARGA